ncbi:hypothetical protein [Aureimonas populi]|uniref:Uncharacterized protein n=1 Tax=Aureimonas populi TaxID=1701758 RepID=A0ABW5CQ51_9HYPH|nr:hypothetical protein [Aureimonas populi]
MTAKWVILEIIAVIAGAVLGTLVSGFAAWLFAGVGFTTALFSLSDYVLALVTVALFALLYARLPGTPAALASLALGILLPTVIDRFAFDQPLGWLALILVNLVFAVAALSAYRFVHANAAVRQVAGRAADR